MIDEELQTEIEDIYTREHGGRRLNEDEVEGEDKQRLIDRYVAENITDHAEFWPEKIQEINKNFKEIYDDRKGNNYVLHYKDIDVLDSLDIKTESLGTRVFDTTVLWWISL